MTVSLQTAIEHGHSREPLTREESKKGKEHWFCSLCHNWFYPERPKVEEVSSVR